MVERSLHDAAAADRDLNVFKTLSRTASTGPLPYQHLFDYLDNRAKLPSAERNQLDFDQLTSEVKQHPDQPEDLYLLAEAYLKSGKIDEAKDTIAQLDKIERRRLSHSHRDRASCWLAITFTTAPSSTFKPRSRPIPTADEVKFDLADALFRARRYPEALEAAGRLSAAGQKDDAYLALLGDIYAHLGDAAHASEIYRSAISRNPDNDQDYLSLALIQLRADDLRRRRRHYGTGNSAFPAREKSSGAWDWSPRSKATTQRLRSSWSAPWICCPNGRAAIRPSAFSTFRAARSTRRARC